ncbi:MlaD family protein, partial [Patulibacter sp. NPDC049589]|uniref:MlaD family protein n=1 Tax=Patulibacter sp. NPDC049589 TaxID=3154731 RepID=UPI003429BAFC
GVDVGQVTKVERGPGGRGAKVTMLVEKGKGVDVKQDASIGLRWRTLLGRNLYVDLKPGSKSAPAIGDTIIPKSRTETQTELDQAIEPFDADGRKAVKTIIDEFDKGFASPAGYRSTVKNLGPAMKTLGPGLRSIRGTEPGDLQRMITNASRTVGALAKSEVQLGDLIDNGSVALGVTAARASDMRALLSTAPGALSETRATMARLRTTLDVLDPVAQQLRPGARKVDDAADDATPLLNAAAPLLRDAKPTVRALRPAVQDLLKLTSSGNALMAAANPVLDQAIYPILPWLRTRSKEVGLKQYEMLGPLTSVAGSVAALGDSNGPVVNFEAGLGESLEQGFSPCKTYISSGDVPLDKKIECETVAKLITGLITGTPVNEVVLKNSSVKNSVTDNLLKTFKDKASLRSLVSKLDIKQGAGR